jgi:regulatory protein YycH of two-component signal transduction system YycFG
MKKFSIRLVILAAILAWPAVLSFQVWKAEQQFDAATKIEQKVSVRLADARAKAAATEVAQKEAR